MTNDDKSTVTCSFGCLFVMLLTFAAVVFVIAAAIKWVTA